MCVYKWNFSFVFIQGVYLKDRRNSTEFNRACKSLPVIELISKLLLDGIKLYRIAAFTPKSMSVACSFPTKVPLARFSSILKW